MRVKPLASAPPPHVGMAGDGCTVSRAEPGALCHPDWSEGLETGWRGQGRWLWQPQGSHHSPRKPDGARLSTPRTGAWLGHVEGRCEQHSQHKEVGGEVTAPSLPSDGGTVTQRGQVAQHRPAPEHTASARRCLPTSCHPLPCRSTRPVPSSSSALARHLAKLCAHWGATHPALAHVSPASELWSSTCGFWGVKRRLRATLL